MLRHRPQLTAKEWPLAWCHLVLLQPASVRSDTVALGAAALFGLVAARTVTVGPRGAEQTAAGAALLVESQLVPARGVAAQLARQTTNTAGDRSN